MTRKKIIEFYNKNDVEIGQIICGVAFVVGFVFAALFLA
jgi:hypothetical protein